MSHTVTSGIARRPSSGTLRRLVIRADLAGLAAAWRGDRGFPTAGLGILIRASVCAEHLTNRDRAAVYMSYGYEVGQPGAAYNLPWDVAKRAGLARIDWEAPAASFLKS